jgi:hypothetical protein
MRKILLTLAAMAVVFTFSRWLFATEDANDPNKPADQSVQLSYSCDANDSNDANSVK